jgi:phage terminase small subunit
MARPLKAIEQKRALGTFKYSRDGGLENPSGNLLAEPVAPPDDLDDVGKKKFLDLQEVLIDLGLLQKIDLENIALAASYYSDYQSIKKFIIGKYTSLANFLDTHNTKTMGLYTKMEKAQDSYIRLLSKYGSSPTDRNKVVIPVKERKSAVEEFMAEE